MYACQTTPQIEHDLAHLEELRTSLDFAPTLHRRWYGRLRRELEAGAVAASTSMEGVPVTEDEVRRILAGDRPASVSAADSSLVSGYRDAMSFVLRRADDPAFRWDAELIRTIHDLVLAHSHAHRAGIYRTGPVYVQDGAGRIIYEAPAAADVSRLVDELCAYAQAAGDLPAPVLAALLHARVAGIHPFGDGNGRAARILASLALYRGGFVRPEFTSLEEWWGRHLADYYAAFRCLGESWQPHADATAFVEAHVHAQRLQVESLLSRERVTGDLWAAAQEIAEDRFESTRFADALFDAFLGRTVTNRYYRELADISIATATTDLARLKDAGLLVATGAGRTRAYTGSGALVAAVAELLGMAHVIAGGDSVGAQRDAVIGELTSITQEREQAQRVLEAVADYGRREAAAKGITTDAEIVRLAATTATR